MNVFSRLGAWLTRPGVAAPRARESDRAPLTTLSKENEEIGWQTLLDDMDRFSQSFDSSASK